MVLAAWHASRRQADVAGAVTLTAAAFAGFSIEAAEGDIELAHTFVPRELEVFWSRVHDALDHVAREEGRQLAAVGGERS